MSDYKSNDNNAETNPINEGFILLTDNKKQKQPSSTKTSTSTVSTILKQTSTMRALSKMPSTTTTCKTKHQTTPTTTTKMMTTTLKRTPNQADSSIVNRTHGRVGRKLLNDPSYDTDIDTSSAKTLLDDDSDVNSFLKVDDEELTKQLVDTAAMADGSGESMYRP
jgi:hypothetical protein